MIDVILYNIRVDPLLKTKLYPPQQRPSLVERPRLLARLNDGWSSEQKSFARKLTLFCAPAGYGKTTLAVQWLHGLTGRDRSPNRAQARSAPMKPPTVPVAWLTLDEADDDPGRFLAYLLAALQEAGLSPGEELAALRHAPQIPPPESVAAAICNALDVAPPLIVAIDDYHRVQGQTIHKVMAHLLAHLPPLAHMVLLTREELPFSLARLRGSGDLVEIRQGDIAFTEAEATVYLTEKNGLRLAPQEIAALERRTEGWIAGLQLAALALRDASTGSGGAEPVEGKFAEGRTPLPERFSSQAFVNDFAGSNKFILDYLLDEVFRQQPEDVRAFLLQTAILDQMCAPLCAAVTARQSSPKSGGAGSQAMLQSLEQGNLFVIPLDGERRWYRYHHLFAGLLRYRLMQEELPVEDLHRRAAAWLAENGFTAEAIKHALAARDWDHAAALIVADSETYLRQGQINTLLRWIEALPEDAVGARPDLSLAAAWAFVLVGRLNEGQNLVEPLALQLEAYPELRGEILTLQMHIARARHDAPRTISLSQQALALLPPQDANARSVINVSLGAAYVYEGDLAKAVEAWTAAAQDGRNAANYYTAALALTFLGQLRAAFGWLHEAADLHRQAIQLGSNEDALPVAARAHVNLAALLYEWHDLDAAGEHLRQALALCELVGDLNVRRDALRVLALVQHARGDAAFALETIRAAEEMLHEHQAPENAHLAVALTHLQLALTAGDLAMAARRQSRIDHVMSQGTAVRPDLLTNAACFTPFPAIPRAQLLLAQGDHAAAAQLLSGCYEAALAGDFSYSLVTTRLLQALAAPDGDTAVGYLADALQHAQPEEYMRSFMINDSSLVGLLHETGRRYPALAPYARRLLALLDRAYDRPDSPTGAQEMLVDPLSERQLEILRLLDRRMTNAEIAQILVLSPNTVKTHLRHIYENLGVHNRRQAVSRARKLGLF